MKLQITLSVDNAWFQDGGKVLPEVVAETLYELAGEVGAVASLGDIPTAIRDGNGNTVGNVRMLD